MGDAEGQNTVVYDVRRILSTMRKQYDEIHIACKRTEEEFQSVREQIRQLDNFNRSRIEEKENQDRKSGDLNNQLDDTRTSIQEAKMSGRVYSHMLERIKKEQSVLRQKVLESENELSQKKAELRDTQRSFNKAREINVQLRAQIESLQAEMLRDEEHHEVQIQELRQAIEAKHAAVQRRKDFDAWRHEIAKGAAADAFQASAGKLQKALAVERILASSLARLLFKRVAEAQPVEDAFQKIRAVTGNKQADAKGPNDTSRSASPSPRRTARSSPNRTGTGFSPNRTGSPMRTATLATTQGVSASAAEVQTIVERFVNRDEDQAKLKREIENAEKEVEALRKEFAELREQTSGLVDSEGSRMRALYGVISDADARLAALLKEHGEVRDRAHAAILQLERTRKWATDLHRLFRAANWDEEDISLEEEEALVDYIRGPLKAHLLKVAALAEEAKLAAANPQTEDEEEDEEEETAEEQQEGQEEAQAAPSSPARSRASPARVIPSLEEREVEEEERLLHDPSFHAVNTRVGLALPEDDLYDALDIGARAAELLGEDRPEVTRIVQTIISPDVEDEEDSDDEDYIRNLRAKTRMESNLLINEKTGVSKAKSKKSKAPQSPAKSAYASPSRSPVRKI